jgi:diaminopimelate decarboxylase
MLRAAFQSAGRAISAVPFPVFTFQLGSNDAMDAAYRTLFEDGLLVPYVNYPDSLGGYFRVAVRADHSREQIERLVRALKQDPRPMKPRPFDDVLLTNLAREHGTPLWVYDAETIRMRIRDLSRFDVVRYAQKANSNLAILDLVRRAGGELDAVSAGEIARGLKAGFAPEQIVFTADLFDARAIEAIVRHDVPVNLGSDS